MLNGVDLSTYQGEIDFHALKAGREVDWIHAKASEGVTYRDDRFAEYHDRAKIVGLPFGAYHFFRGDADGAEQARSFLAACAGREGQVLPMVDCEEGGVGGVDAQTYLARLLDFLRVVDATLNGKRTLIYFGYAFWKDFLGGYDGFAGHPAWPAAYCDDADLDMSGTGWSDWTIWQHSDGTGLTPISGISGNVDRDRLNGDDLSVILR